MTSGDCTEIRERIPDYVAGRLSGAEMERTAAHLGGCPACGGEAELVQLLFEAAPAAPPALATAVKEAVARGAGVVPGQGGVRPWWGLAAASVAALAIGIGVTTGSPRESELDVPAFASQVEESGGWLTEDGLIAGDPALDALSDEALRTLLAELSGGAA